MVRVDPRHLESALVRLSALTGTLADGAQMVMSIRSSLSDNRAWNGAASTAFDTAAGRLGGELSKARGVFEDVVTALRQLQVNVSQYEMQLNSATAAAIATSSAAVQNDLAYLKMVTGAPYSSADATFAKAENTLAGLEPQFSAARDALAASLKRTAHALTRGAAAAPALHWRSAALPKPATQPAGPQGWDAIAPQVGTLFDGPPTPAQIQEGYLVGSCFLLSPAAALALTHPRQLTRLIRYRGNGLYTVKLFNNGWRRYTVDATLLEGAGAMPVYGYLGQSVLWPAILEKAWAEASGGYPNIDGGGIPDLTLSALTGEQTRTQATSGGPAAVSTFILQAQHAHRPLVLSSNPTQVPLARGMLPLVANHVYYLQSYDPATGMVTLGNPWGIGDNPPPLTIDQVCRAFGTLTATTGTPMPVYHGSAAGAVG